MCFSLLFFANSVLLGTGLAMDAFSVSIANGLNEPGMSHKKECLMAGVYAFFQFIMPMIGWLCVHTMVSVFTSLQRYVSFTALPLLAYIGGKMIVESVKKMRSSGEGDAAAAEISTAAGMLDFHTLMLQGIATSIDALSVGFTIAAYDTQTAFTASLIIAAVTFIICMGGSKIGRHAGAHLTDKAGILGGCILIFIGIEIFCKALFSCV